MKDPLQDVETRHSDSEEVMRTHSVDEEDEAPMARDLGPMYWNLDDHRGWLPPMFVLWTFGILLPGAVIAYLIWGRSP